MRTQSPAARVWRTAVAELDAADGAWTEALHALYSAEDAYCEPERPAELEPWNFGTGAALLRGAELRRHCESRIFPPIVGWKIAHVDQAVRRIEAWHAERDAARARLNLPALEAAERAARDRYWRARAAALRAPAATIGILAEKFALVQAVEGGATELELIARDIQALADQEGCGARLVAA